MTLVTSLFYLQPRSATDRYMSFIGHLLFLSTQLETCLIILKVKVKKNPYDFVNKITWVLYTMHECSFYANCYICLLTGNYCSIYLL